MKIISSLFFLCVCIQLLHAQKTNEPVPSARQLQWHDQEFYLFTHFGPNTFTDLEWGKGTEKEEVFDPTQLDCKQWCRIAKAAGAKGIIITAKHHDGFCLWPSQYSLHTVAQSKWRDGKGDVLQELSDACKAYNLKLGIYLSPWDRNHPKYGTDEYNDVFVNMMREVVTRYGPLFEFWWDGANGEGPNGKKQVYDWHRFEQTMRTIAPNTPVFSDIGPDIRWVGNEKGFAGATNWNLLDTAGYKRGEGSPSTDTLNRGNYNGKNWIPAECDVSIRPGWFYHANEDDKVKTPKELFDLYLKSVGRGANLLLNVPPDRRGLINEHDSAALMGFKKLRDESFAANLASKAKSETFYDNMLFTKQFFADGDVKTFEKNIDYKKTSYWLRFANGEKINCIVLREAIEFGQHVSGFKIELLDGIKVLQTINGTTIGRKRIITFPVKQISAIRFLVTDTKAAPLISEIEVYNIDDKLVEKE
ncbi:MAG: alpha-L-fucosidase [Panacibacter sp.]